MYNLERRSIRGTENKNVVSRWRPPVEAFVPIPELAEPILSIDISSSIPDDKISLSKNEVLLAHETDLKSSKSILDDGFQPSNREMSPLRDRAVFGWIHQKDIGYLMRNDKQECNRIVLFKAPRDTVYVSSYETSAYFLALGEITPEEYERRHVLNLEEYECILRKNSEILDHLDYSLDSLIYRD